MAISRKTTLAPFWEFNLVRSIANWYKLSRDKEKNSPLLIKTSKEKYFMHAQLVNHCWELLVSLGSHASSLEGPLSRWWLGQLIQEGLWPPFQVRSDRRELRMSPWKERIESTCAARWVMVKNHHKSTFLGLQMVPKFLRRGHQPSIELTVFCSLDLWNRDAGFSVLRVRANPIQRHSTVWQTWGRNRKDICV